MSRTATFAECFSARIHSFIMNQCHESGSYYDPQLAKGMLIGRGKDLLIGLVISYLPIAINIGTWAYS